MAKAHAQRPWYRWPETRPQKSPRARAFSWGFQKSKRAKNEPATPNPPDRPLVDTATGPLTFCLFESKKLEKERVKQKCLALHESKFQRMKTTRPVFLRNVTLEGGERAFLWMPTANAKFFLQGADFGKKGALECHKIATVSRPRRD